MFDGGKCTAPLPWFRMYGEFMTDPMIQMLAFEDQRHYVMALCMKSQGLLDKQYPSPEFRRKVICATLGLDRVAADDANRRLQEHGLVDDQWQPIAWERRQFKTDHNAAERQRKSREERKRRLNNHVTALSRDSHHLDTEQIQRQTRTENTDAREDGNVPRGTEHAEQPRRVVVESLPPGLLAKIRQTYPGSHTEATWQQAQRRIEFLVEDGESADDIVANVAAYAHQQQAKGNTSAFFNPYRFFAEGHWRGPFDLPPPDKAEKPRRRLRTAEEIEADERSRAAEGGIHAAG